MSARKSVLVAGAVLWAGTVCFARGLETAREKVSLNDNAAQAETVLEMLEAGTTGQDLADALRPASCEPAPAVCQPPGVVGIGPFVQKQLEEGVRGSDLADAIRGELSIPLGPPQDQMLALAAGQGLGNVPDNGHTDIALLVLGQLSAGARGTDLSQAIRDELNVPPGPPQDQMLALAAGQGLGNVPGNSYTDIALLVLEQLSAGARGRDLSQAIRDELNVPPPADGVLGGDMPDEMITAMAVPEPLTLGVLGLGGLALLRRRKGR